MGIFHPDINRHLIADEGEVVVDEVRRHWVVYLVPALLLVVAAAVFLMVFFVPVDVAWVPLVFALGLGGYAGVRIWEQHMDRFVVTNIRVFRVRGILAQNLGTMPMARILDIAVHKPLLGRLIGYGHFIFESAARGQGLHDIRYVPNPDERDLTIQRVIQRAGLRGAARIGDGS